MESLATSNKITEEVISPNPQQRNDGKEREIHLPNKELFIPKPSAIFTFLGRDHFLHPA